MGIRDRPISPGSPWQNGYAERLIGTVRRECLDRLLIFGEAHLRRVLASYAVYYNQVRTHLALQKDAPLHRPVQRSGAVVAIPILAGLHHQYVRMWFSERTGTTTNCKSVVIMAAVCKRGGRCRLIYRTTRASARRLRSLIILSPTRGYCPDLPMSRSCRRSSAGVQHLCRKFTNNGMPHH